MNFSDKTVLVTGGAGFIGSHVCQALTSKGVRELRIVDNLLTGKQDHIKGLLSDSRVKFYPIDVRSPEIIHLLNDADVVFHLAARNITFSVIDPTTDLDVNARGTLNMLECSLKEKVETFVYASSASVYGRPEKFPEREDDRTMPVSSYGISKLTGEYYCWLYHKVHGLKTVSLRYSNIYGPRQESSFYGGVIPRFIKNILQDKPPEIYGDGTQTRDFTYIDDCTKATLLASVTDEVAGEVINIASARETSVKELAQMLIKISGKPEVKPIYVPKRPVLDDVERRLCSTEKAKRLLGYANEVPLEEGLTRTYEWYKNAWVWISQHS